MTAPTIPSNLLPKRIVDLPSAPTQIDREIVSIPASYLGTTYKISALELAGTLIFEANSGATGEIASTAQINEAIANSSQLTSPRNGDMFIDTSPRFNNRQPVYIYVNRLWRQFLTAYQND